MAKSPKGGERCTLNGFLNNYVNCLYRIERAFLCSRDWRNDQPPTPLKVDDKECLVGSVTNPRLEAIDTFVEPAMAALETWLVPSMEEAREMGVLAALAEPIRAARHAIQKFRTVVWQSAAEDGTFDLGFQSAQAAATAAFQELEVLQPLVLKSRRKLRRASEQLAAGGGIPTLALRPPVLRAWSSFDNAVRKELSLSGLTDKEIFGWIVENDPDSDYSKGGFETWVRYVREARLVSGASKNSSRQGRGGRSITTPGGGPTG